MINKEPIKKGGYVSWAVGWTVKKESAVQSGSQQLWLLQDWWCIRDCPEPGCWCVCVCEQYW